MTLREVRAAGVDLGAGGCNLALQADKPPPAGLLERLARHKPEIVALLWPGRGGWSVEDWQTYFDEHVGIAELDGGLPRPKAEAVAALKAMGIVPPAKFPDDFGKSGGA